MKIMNLKKPNTNFTCTPESALTPQKVSETTKFSDSVFDNSNNPLALLSIGQAAKCLKVGKARIYELIDKSEIGIIEFENGTIKIPQSELVKWVQGRITYKPLTKTAENGKKTRNIPEFNVQSVMNKIIAGKNIHE